MKKLILTLALGLGMSLPMSAQEITSRGVAVQNTNGEFDYLDFKRRAVGDDDILIETLYASICHSDIHASLGHWGPRKYPFVPGHEILGRVVKVGKNVTRFKVGDLAGVGCIVATCAECDQCREGFENHCRHGFVGPYAEVDRYHGGEFTQGGYSKNYVIGERWAVRIPANCDPKRTVPLLCAGITTYSPIRYLDVKKGTKFGVAGYGGLGHMAVKYAVAMGAEVTVFDITEDKREDARKMGAVRYVNVNNKEEVNAVRESLDCILNTIPYNHSVEMYLDLLRKGGELCYVGVPAGDQTPSLNTTTMVFHSNRKLSGSVIGGIPETEEAVRYAVEHDICPDVEVIPATPEALEQAYKNVQAGKVKFRYSIDMSTLK